MGREAVSDVLVLNGIIADVGEIPEADSALVIDASDYILCPGFVDGHRHLWQTNLRGLLANNVLGDYYRKVRVGLSTAYTAADLHTSVLAGAIEALADGVTSVIDHAHIINSPDHADAAIDALLASGTRAIFCYGFYSAPVKDSVFTTTSARHSDLVRVRRNRLPSDTGRITLGAALTEHWICATEVSRAEIEVARSLSLKRITAHIGSSPKAGDVQRYSDIKGYGSDITFSHANACPDEFFQRVAQSGGGLIATPETELGMGMGFTAITRAIKASVPIGLGADTVAYGGADMFTVARQALISLRAVENQSHLEKGNMPTSNGVSTHDALRWLTNEGARAAGLNSDIGAIEVGKRADLLLISTRGLHMAPLPDLASAIVMHARPSDIEAVFVEGQPRKLGDEILGVDMEALAKRVRQSQNDIFRRVASTTDGSGASARAYDVFLASS